MAAADNGLANGSARSCILVFCSRTTAAGIRFLHTGHLSVRSSRPKSMGRTRHPRTARQMSWMANDESVARWRRAGVNFDGRTSCAVCRHGCGICVGVGTRGWGVVDGSSTRGSLLLRRGRCT